MVYDFLQDIELPLAAENLAENKKNIFPWKVFWFLLSIFVEMKRTFSAIFLDFHSFMDLWFLPFFNQFFENFSSEFTILAALALYAALWWINCFIVLFHQQKLEEINKNPKWFKWFKYLLFTNLIDSQRIFNNSIATI